MAHPRSAVRPPEIRPTTSPPFAEASAPAPVSDIATPASVAPTPDATLPDAARLDASGADAAFIAALGSGTSSDAVTEARDYVQDFCVQADQDRILYVLGRSKASSAEAQAADKPDLRILQLPRAALRVEAVAAGTPAIITPTVFADLADLAGPAPPRRTGSCA